LVRDSKLRLQILAEKARAEKCLSDLELQNLSLRIRDDEIEINGLGVRVKEMVLPAQEILAVRFGAADDKSPKAFQVELAANPSRHLLIDCHRLWRGKAQTAADFERITRALRTHIASQIAGRIARTINFGGSYVISEMEPGLFSEEFVPKALAMIGKGGLVTPREPNHPSEMVRIPLNELRSQIQGGILLIQRAGSETPIARWQLRQVWNAAFFTEIVDAIRRHPADAIRAAFGGSKPER
jgi:hypothetical protein